MADDDQMRTRLRHVAAYRELCRGVRGSGRGNIFFALLMLFLAYYTFNPNAGGVAQFVFLLYIGLALGEFAVGLFKWVHPSAEGVLLDGLVLLIFAGWNLGWQGLGLAAGVKPNAVIVFLGLFMLFGAVGRFKAYVQFRRLFADRPPPEHVAWFDELVREIRAADPRTDELALDLPTRPHWKAKLLGTTAFFVAARGEAVCVAGADEFALAREKKDRGTGHRKAVLRLYDYPYPEFDIADPTWDNYQRWLTANTP